MNLEEAKKFRLKFGKRKNMPLWRIDTGYLFWLLATNKDLPDEVVAALLAVVHERYSRMLEKYHLGHLVRDLPLTNSI